MKDEIKKLETDFNRVLTLGLPAGAQREGERCLACGEESEYRVCDECGAGAWIIDCGDYAQPRPIAAGRVDGSDLHHTYCDVCAIGEKMKVKNYISTIDKEWHVIYLPPYLCGVHVGLGPEWQILLGPGTTPSIFNQYVSPDSIPDFWDAEVNSRGIHEKRRNDEK